LHRLYSERARVPKYERIVLHSSVFLQVAQQITGWRTWRIGQLSTAVAPVVQSATLFAAISSLFPRLGVLVWVVGLASGAVGVVIYLTTVGVA
jgi:hypothetical protein